MSNRLSVPLTVPGFAVGEMLQLLTEMVTACRVRAIDAPESNDKTRNKHNAWVAVGGSIEASRDLLRATFITGQNSSDDNRPTYEDSLQRFRSLLYELTGNSAAWNAFDDSFKTLYDLAVSRTYYIRNRQKAGPLTWAAWAVCLGELGYDVTWEQNITHPKYRERCEKLRKQLKEMNSKSEN